MKCKAIDSGDANEIVKGVLPALVAIHSTLAHTGGLARAVGTVPCPHHPGTGWGVASLHLIPKERGFMDPRKV